MKLLAWRNARMVRHERQTLVAKLIQAIIFGILYDCVWWDIGGKYDYENVLSTAGMCFSLCTA